MCLHVIDPSINQSLSRWLSGIYQRLLVSRTILASPLNDHHQIRKCAEFPSGSVVKNSTANAVGHKFNPWSGKIPRPMEQLSLCTPTSKAHSPWSPCSTTREATAVRRLCTVESSPNSPQLEKTRVQR